MNGPLPTLVVLALLSAGCVQIVAEPSESLTPQRESVAPPRTETAPATWTPKEILNETYAYPEFGMGSHANDTFQAPRTTALLGVRAHWKSNCPLYYQKNPRFYLQAPNGTTTQVRMNETMNPNSTGYLCFRGDLPRILNVTGAEGTWRIWTAGEMRGSVQVTIIARPPRSG